MTDQEIINKYTSMNSNIATWNKHNNKANTLADSATQFDSAFFGLGALASNTKSSGFSPINIGKTIDHINRWTDPTYAKYAKDPRITAVSAGHRRAQAHRLAANDAALAAKKDADAITNEYNTRVKQNASANYKVDNYSSNLYRR